jgi:hypothetical protein
MGRCGCGVASSRFIAPFQGVSMWFEGIHVQTMPIIPNGIKGDTHQATLPLIEMWRGLCTVNLQDITCVALHVRGSTKQY